MNKLERETFFSYKHLKDEEMKAASAMFKPVLEAIENLEQAQKELAEALNRVQHQTNATLPPNAQRAATRRKIEMLGAHTQSNTTGNLYQLLVEAKDCAVRSVVLRRAEQKQDEEKANEDLDRESRQAQAELSKPPEYVVVDKREGETVYVRTREDHTEEDKQEELHQIRDRVAPYVMTGAKVREVVQQAHKEKIKRLATNLLAQLAHEQSGVFSGPEQFNEVVSHLAEQMQGNDLTTTKQEVAIKVTQACRAFSIVVDSKAVKRTVDKVASLSPLYPA